jgi:hypothetical protein
METLTMSPQTAEAKSPMTIEIPALTTSYEKAHKSYVLAAALLGSWQLIGVTIETKEKWGITLKSPSAVPFILVSLVLYFGYKVKIDWMQCDERRQKHIAAKVDYRVAHGLGVTSLLITFGQYLYRVQFFDIVRDALIAIVDGPEHAWPAIRQMTQILATIFCIGAMLLIGFPQLGFIDKYRPSYKKPFNALLWWRATMVLLIASYIHVVIRSVKIVGYSATALMTIADSVLFVLLWFRGVVAPE